MYINMECKQSYWEDSKPSISIVNNSYHGSIIVQTRNGDNASPPIQSIHDDVCKEENSIYQYCDRNFNFSANVAGGVTSEEDDYHHTSPKRKIAVTRDPMSHRIIEKRRRDRMNNCLADLSRLIPSEYLKKGRGRIEKTEIIEMAIKHMKFLQAQICTTSENCKIKVENGHHIMVADSSYSTNPAAAEEREIALQEHYRFGYQECLGETLHFLVEEEGFYQSDALCVKLMNHLQEYFKKVVPGNKSVNRNPLENIVLPNSYERKANGRPTISISEVKERTRRSSAASTLSESDSPYENINGTSQLREMLVGPHLNSFCTPITQNIVRHDSSPEPSPPSVSSSGSLFKFKNYIQERFSAERSNLNYVRYSSDSSKRVSLIENNPPTPSVVVCGNKRKAEWITEQDPSTTPSSTKETEQIVDSKPVPIFALHGEGAFYVPLSVDSHILQPFLTELNHDYGIDGFSSAGLHPVTISVNFNRPSSSKSSEFKGLISPNISHHSTTLHIVPECR